MADPAFWRDLLAQFASLDATPNPGAQFEDDAPWMLQLTGSFYSRFRTFAMRGGAAAVVGTTGEAAVDAWLNLLRERLPHYVEMGAMQEYPTRQTILLSRIDPPSAADVADDAAIPQLWARRPSGREAFGRSVRDRSRSSPLYQP
jgi:hypothetical protein